MAGRGQCTRAWRPGQWNMCASWTLTWRLISPNETVSSSRWRSLINQKKEMKHLGKCHKSVIQVVLLWVCFRHRQFNLTPRPFPLREENMQIFPSAGAVLLVAKAAWHIGFELSPVQPEPITPALTTCPTPTSSLKIPALRGGKKSLLFSSCDHYNSKTCTLIKTTF